MSKIATYSLADSPLQLSDRLIGTEAPRPTPSSTPLATKNFSLQELLQLFSANFPAATLQAVLDAGNIATQNITLTGTISATLIKPVNIEDISGSQGSVFQVLSKAVSGVNWVNLPSASWGSITGTITLQTDLINYLSTNYFAKPTGTISQYIRGNGSLATFPTVPVVVPSALTKTDDTNVTLTLGGFPSISLLEPVSLTLGWTGTLADSRIASASVWNAKQGALSGTGIVKSTGGTITYINGTTAQYIRGDGSLATFPSSLTPTLQQVLDNNHDLIDGNNFQGTLAGFNNTGVNVNAFGGYAASNNTGTSVNAMGGNSALQNTGTNVNAFGYDAGRGNTKDNLNAFGSNAGLNNTGNSLNSFGVNAGRNNTGNYVNTLGENAGSSNTGSNVNAIGNGAAVLNSGNNVNAFGIVAGQSNSFNNVNLFGYYVSADADNQNVFSKWIGGTTKYLGRLSFNNITADRKWELPNASGTIALTSDIPASGVTSVGLTMPPAFTVTNSPITSSGDIAVTGAGLVSQYVRGDGTLANFPTSTGGGASVSYYLNGSVSQGTIGGIAYKEINGTPVIGTGTDFTINADGYIAQFITDVGDPNKLLIPAGNWNFETYFSASSGGGSPKFYIELYKYNGTTFTLIASNSATPENITGGTSIDLYFTALAIPQTTLLATDRLAVRFYVIHSGRTITMHTEDSHLSQIITTFSTGLTALNGLTDQVQFFDVGTGATNFNISSSGDTHTFNLLFNIRRNANNSSNNNINYNGYAVTGSAESSAVWTITRLTIAASGSITTATATNVAWTNRESAIYI